MEIKVLGTGCSRCKLLYDNTKKAVSSLNLTTPIEYVTDVIKIVETGLMSTPGLMINGKIVSAGRVPSDLEIKELINKYK
jgi:small redox-active disulfide protein 2